MLEALEAPFVNASPITAGEILVRAERGSPAEE